MDILSLLPEAFIVANENQIKTVFYGCRNLTCSDYEKLANIFWNNQKIDWEVITSTSSSGLIMYPFTGCSATLRNNVPQSWGGTASDDLISNLTESKQPWILKEVTVEINSLDYIEIDKVRGGYRYNCEPGLNVIIRSIENSPIESEIVLSTMDLGNEGDYSSIFFPESLIWIKEPSFKYNKQYIINIRNNIAICVEVPAGV